MKTIFSDNLLLKILIITCAIVVSCDSRPKVIQSDDTKEQSETQPIFNLDQPSVNTTTIEHTVTVKEILDTEKYNYLKVEEGEDEFWIAITKRKVAAGEEYTYKSGLLKKNFYSREFDRVFETVYLVSDLWRTQQNDDQHEDHHAAEHVKVVVGEIQRAEGSIAIAQLIEEKEDYNGKIVQITGKCVKVNPMIMNRNWLHIMDEADGLELVVTTTATVPLGAIVNLEGVIGLDRDFGAGYRYDIIMESATVQ